MEKEFVPYEQALALKELGFNEPCFAWYDGKYTSSINQDYCKNSEEWLNTIHCAAPLYSQAFRWFRENHNLHSCVAPTYEDDSSKVILYWFWIQGFDSFEDEDIDYQTREETELICLRKLIQITKENK